MQDLKLNELPVEGEGEFVRKEGVPLTPEQEAELKRRQGLSIRDTVAGDTVLSAGGQGVDTSGTKAGAGAGGGMTSITPGDTGTPAPDMVGPARGTGMTPQSTGDFDKKDK